MGIHLFKGEEVEKLRIAGKLASDVLVMLEPHIKPGVTTEYLDDLCMDYITNTQKAISACLGYHGYPKCVCTSVNEVVCHGIPSSQRLREGDIVNVDVTVIKDGYYGDTSKMFVVGETSPLKKQLVEVTQECLYTALKTVHEGSNLKEIGDVIQNIADKHGYSIVKTYCGHGIGTEFHTEPTVLHYKNPNSLVLKEGMVFTIEPMINVGTWKTKTSKKDGWTVTTADGLPSAQFEHTIIVTKEGCEILTHRDEETNLPRVLKNI